MGSELCPPWRPQVCHCRFQRTGIKINETIGATYIGETAKKSTLAARQL